MAADRAEMLLWTIQRKAERWEGVLLRCVVTHIQVTNQWLSVVASANAEVSTSVMMILYNRLVYLSSFRYDIQDIRLQQR